MTNNTLPDMILDDARGYNGQVKIVVQLANDRGAEIKLPEPEQELEHWFEADELATEFLQQHAPEGHWVGWEDGSWGVREIVD